MKKLKTVCFTSLDNYSSTKILPEISKKHNVKIVIIQLPKNKPLIKKFKWLYKYFGGWYVIKRILGYPFRKIVLLLKNDKVVKKQGSIIEICEDINSIDHEITVTDSTGRKLSWYKEFFKNLNI